MIDRAKIRMKLEDLDGLIDETTDTLNTYDNAIEDATAYRTSRAPADAALDELRQNVVGILVEAAAIVEETTLNR